MAVTCVHANSPAFAADGQLQRFEATRRLIDRSGQMEIAGAETASVTRREARPFLVLHTTEPSGVRSPHCHQHQGQRLGLRTSLPRQKAPLLRPDETLVLFLSERVKFSKDLVGGNALDDTIVDLAAAALNFGSPRGINTWVRWAVEFLEQYAQQLRLVRRAKCPDFLLNYGNCACHTVQRTSAAASTQP